MAAIRTHGVLTIPKPFRIFTARSLAQFTIHQSCDRRGITSPRQRSTLFSSPFQQRQIPPPSPLGATSCEARKTCHRRGLSVPVGVVEHGSRLAPNLSSPGPVRRRKNWVCTIVSSILAVAGGKPGTCVLVLRPFIRRIKTSVSDSRRTRTHMGQTRSIPRVHLCSCSRDVSDSENTRKVSRPRHLIPA